MALETLVHAQQEAAGILDIDYELIEERQEQTVHNLGLIEMPGHEPMQAWRVHTGEEGLIAKGGVRLDPVGGLALARELSAEMEPKVKIRGHVGYRGGKAIIEANPYDPTLDKEELARRFATRMVEAGLARADTDQPAGDIGFNGLSDTYVKTVHELDEDYLYWQATATGKSPDMGGLGFRPNATGFGGYVNQLCAMEARGVERARTAIQGFGNVGAWHAHYASNHPKGEVNLTINAISEREGILTTDDEAGLVITKEMVRLVGDNKNFMRDFGGRTKLAVLKEMIEKNQPGIRINVHSDPKGIISYPCEFFVPAAGPDVLNESNVDSLGATVAVNEDANGPMTPDAYHRVVERGLLVVPDFIDNGGGVDCSIAESEANVAFADSGKLPPTDAEMQAHLEKGGRQLFQEVMTASQEMGTKDLRVAASGLYIARILPGQTGLQMAA